MKISKDMEIAINIQINAELYSAYLYYSMQAYFEDQNLKGFANWMNIQAKEEMTHANKFFNFIYERGGKVVLDAIEKPGDSWKDLEDVFSETLAHEQKVTGLINNLVTIAKEESDYATESMLRWFIDEQVEEEANAEEILQKIKLMKNAPGGMFMLDSELAKRVFVDATIKTE